MVEKGFIFDYSKCVGCHACMVACYNENHTQPPISWRQVQSSNPLKVPLLGFINLSIACNHCLDAPCLKACPAQAYKIDVKTLAVIHHAGLCIGCTYCTWACPFDAPRYNRSKGVVEKCNFCNDRLKEALAPACVSSCPTGALGFGDIEVADAVVAPGMPSKSIKPRINTRGESVITSVPEMDIAITGYSPDYPLSNQIKSKVDAIKEWPLAIFTFLSSVMVGWIIYIAMKFPDAKHPYFFGILGFVGMILSTFHLGKPFRAYRSVFNFKTSWLSREVLLFIAFYALSTLSLFANLSITYYRVSALAGVLLLISVEYVYSVTAKKYAAPFHSANTLLTAISFGFILADLSWGPLILLTLKAILYIYRYSGKQVTFKSFTVSFVRFFVGVIIPLAGIILESKYRLIIVVPFILGELIDRFEYYADLDVDTPQKLLISK